MPLRKISEPTKEEICQSPEHDIPKHIALSPGTYEYECPSCGKKQQFIVPLITSSS